MENVDLRIPLLHPLQKRIHRGLVVVGGEARAKPQAEAPAGDLARLPREHRVPPQHVLGRGPVDEVPLQPLAFDARLHTAAPLAPDLELYLSRRVDEDAVAPRTQPERDVLVRLVARGAAVGVPQRDRLSHFIEGAESLSESVDGLADA